MKNLKENAAYLLLLIPTLTEWLESGHSPSDARSVITDVVMTLMVLLLILISRKKERKIKILQQKAKENKMFDPLTGLPLRERFLEDLSRIIEHSKADKETVHLICIDIDHFRDINEEYGSIKGDKIIKNLVNRIKVIIPEDKGHLYRLGGDTFALFFLEETALKAEAIVSDLVTLNASGNKLLESYKSSITLGISTLSQNQNAQDFWSHAVKDMQSKRLNAEKT